MAICGQSMHDLENVLRALFSRVPHEGLDSGLSFLWSFGALKVYPNFACCPKNTRISCRVRNHRRIVRAAGLKNHAYIYYYISKVYGYYTFR